jgi:hypothetical protein
LRDHPDDPSILFGEVMSGNRKTLTRRRRCALCWAALLSTEHNLCSACLKDEIYRTAKAGYQLLGPQGGRLTFNRWHKDPGDPFK